MFGRMFANFAEQIRYVFEKYCLYCLKKKADPIDREKVRRNVEVKDRLDLREHELADRGLGRREEELRPPRRELLYGGAP